MTYHDDDLTRFAATGSQPLPPADEAGHVETSGARIWYATFGKGPAVVLLHGGMGNATNWGFQVPALVEAGYRAIVIDSRGQGRSSNDGRPFSYAQMADHTLAVLDTVGILDRAALIGWSDGACTALVLADNRPERAAGIFFFACNVDPSGTKPFVYTETIGRCLERHKLDFAALSPSPEAFDATFEAVGAMQGSQPNYTADDLARLRVPFWSVIGEGDEFITQDHAAYLAQAVPGAQHHVLRQVSHFAPVQRPKVFNAAMLRFLSAVHPRGTNFEESPA
jgi:pimeloyl-ACP methyl ester carboxylesterase